MIVTRPVISRALSDIEKEIGVKLFDRKSSGITPNEHGVILFNMFDSFSKTYMQTVERLRNLSLLNESRNLRIGMMDASSGWFYPVLFRPFHERYPDITILVDGLQPEEASRLLIDGVVDIAVSPVMEDSSPLLKSFYLYTTQWVLCSPIDLSIDVDEVTTSGCREYSIAILETLPPPTFYEYKDIVLSTKDPEMVRIAVAGGFAHAVLPLEICSSWEDVKRRPFVPALRPKIHLLWNGAIPHNQAFHSFMDFCNGVDFEPLRSAWGNYAPE